MKWWKKLFGVDPAGIYPFDVEQAEIYPDDDADPASETVPDSSQTINTNEVAETCGCGRMLEQPPNTGELAAKACKQCDRIPKGEW